MLDVALGWPKVTLGISVAAVAVGIVLCTGVPNFLESQEPGKPPPAPFFKGIQTGLMPEMDEGAFVVDYWAPSGTPLSETEAMARTIEDILSKNPDVEAYVRRTGAELGMFATQTSRGDIQVVLRSAQDDPISLLTKPIRPGFTDPVPGEGKTTLEEMIKVWGTAAAEKKYGAKLAAFDAAKRDQLIW